MPPASFSSSELPFGGLGASFVTFWEFVLASGAPWEANSTLQDYPGGPLEQQNGFEVVDNRMVLDLGVILRRVYVSFRNLK